MTTPRAALYGGPRDSDVVPIDSFAVLLRFPRYRDDGQLVHDVYEFNGATFDRDTPAPYRYVGAAGPPVLDPEGAEPEGTRMRNIPLIAWAAGVACLLASGLLISYSDAYKQVVTLTIPDHCAAGAKCLSAAVSDVYLHHPNWSDILQYAGLGLIGVGTAWWLLRRRTA